MIQSFVDYERYLEADRVALGRDHAYGFKDWLMDDIWTFQRLLRRVEYYHNCVRSLWGVWYAESYICVFTECR